MHPRQHNSLVSGQSCTTPGSVARLLPKIPRLSGKPNQFLGHGHRLLLRVSAAASRARLSTGKSTLHLHKLWRFQIKGFSGFRVWGWDRWNESFLRAFPLGPNDEHKHSPRSLQGLLLGAKLSM